MDYSQDKVDEAVLALLYLTLHDEFEWDGNRGGRAWKGHDWDAMERLHEKGYIGNPRGKAKSVVLTNEGIEKSRELFEKMFGK